MISKHDLVCSNVASLLLGRSATRRREMAVRTAMGATRGDVIRQYLTESLVLATVGERRGLAALHVAVPVEWQSIIDAMVPPYTYPGMAV